MRQYIGVGILLAAFVCNWPGKVCASYAGAGAGAGVESRAHNMPSTPSHMMALDVHQSLLERAGLLERAILRLTRNYETQRKDFMKTVGYQVLSQEYDVLSQLQNIHPEDPQYNREILLWMVFNKRNHKGDQASPTEKQKNLKIFEERFAEFGSAGEDYTAAGYEGLNEVYHLPLEKLKKITKFTVIHAKFKNADDAKFVAENMPYLRTLKFEYIFLEDTDIEIIKGAGFPKLEDLEFLYGGAQEHSALAYDIDAKIGATVTINGTLFAYA